MGVQGVIQRLTKYAGQGAVFGGALYYAVKEYRYPNLQRVDLLKDSYNNLKKTFERQKVRTIQVYCWRQKYMFDTCLYFEKMIN